MPSASVSGASANALVTTVERLGVKLSSADRAEYASEWVTPVSTDYRGWKVYELPPNSQGIGPLEMLLKEPSISEIMINAPKAGYV